jgi:uncharacterized membrane protein
MTAPHATEIINGYLARLEAEAADLLQTERRELIDGVREHLAEARAAMPDETDADLLNLLDRLGDPAELAAEERERLNLPTSEPARVGLLEIGALVLTPLVWPIGVIMLWTSSAWNARDKLIGTLVPPGGLFTSWTIFFIGLEAPAQGCSSGTVNGHHLATTCSGGVNGIEAVLLGILLVLILLSPIITGIYLGLRLQRRTRARRIHAVA